MKRISKTVKALGTPLLVAMAAAALPAIVKAQTDSDGAPIGVRQAQMEDLSRQLGLLEQQVAGIEDILDELREVEARLVDQWRIASQGAADLRERVISDSEGDRDLARQIVEADESLALLLERVKAIREGRLELEQELDSLAATAALPSSQSSSRPVSSPTEEAPAPTPVKVRPPIAASAPAPQTARQQPATQPAIPAPTTGQRVAVAPPVGSEPEAPTAPPLADSAEPDEVVRAWAGAWEKREIKEYLAFYSADFEPPEGLTRKAWESRRRKALKRAKRPSVTLSELEVAESGNGTAVARFTQLYQAGDFTNTVAKRLDLNREDDGVWRIVLETVEKILPNPLPAEVEDS